MRKLKIIMLVIILFVCNSLNVAPTALNLSDEEKAKIVYNFMEYRRYDAAYESFTKQLGLDESSNNWLAINDHGAFGEWQFINSTVKFLGYNVTCDQFKRDPNIFPKELQRKVLDDLIESNTIVMRKYIAQFENKRFYGIKITKAGILAACHLAGPKTVQDFLLGKLDHIPSDAYGTTVLKYMKKYEKYDIDLHLI